MLFDRFIIFNLLTGIYSLPLEDSDGVKLWKEVHEQGTPSYENQNISILGSFFQNNLMGLSYGKKCTSKVHLVIQM